MVDIGHRLLKVQVKGTEQPRPKYTKVGAVPTYRFTMRKPEGFDLVALVALDIEVIRYASPAQIEGRDSLWVPTKRMETPCDAALRELLSVTPPLSRPIASKPRAARSNTQRGCTPPSPLPSGD